MKRHLCAAAAALLLGSAGAGAQTTLNVGMSAADVNQLDPYRATTTQDKPLTSWLYNGLVRFKPGSASLETLEPDLAERWESTPDKLTWTFHLRKGVKFHGDYGMLTADDVVFSLKRAADSKTSSFSADYASIDTVEAVDPLTVRVKLKQAVPFFLGLVTNYHGGNVVSRKAVEKLGDNFRLNPIGTGPFKFEAYKPNESVTFLANKDYFRGAPKIDRIVYHLIPADSARDLAFTSGELDIVYGRQDQKWAERFKKEPGVIVDVLRPAELGLLHLNMTVKPLDDKRVRQAIAHAINRPQIVSFKGDLTADPAGLGGAGRLPRHRRQGAARDLRRRQGQGAPEGGGLSERHHRQGDPVDLAVDAEHRADPAGPAQARRHRPAARDGRPPDLPRQHPQGPERRGLLHRGALSPSPTCR